jgi:hypothetical protein
VFIRPYRDANSEQKNGSGEEKKFQLFWPLLGKSDAYSYIEGFSIDRERTCGEPVSTAQEQPTMDEKQAGGAGCAIIVGLCLLIGSCVGNNQPSQQDLREIEKKNIEWEAGKRLEQQNQEIRDVIHELKVQEEMKRQRGW